MAYLFRFIYIPNFIDFNFYVGTTNNNYLHNSNSYAHATEHHSDILKVSDEFVQAAVFVEVFGGLSARGSHSAGDLLAWAARAGQGGDVVGSPVTGTVDTAALQLETRIEKLVGVVWQLHKIFIVSLVSHFMNLSPVL